MTNITKPSDFKDKHYLTVFGLKKSKKNSLLTFEFTLQKKFPANFNTNVDLVLIR